jgi:hypothetical protein
MSLSKKLTLFIGLMALGTTSAWAACTRLRTYGEINMAMGGWLLARLTSRIGVIALTGQCRQRGI